MDEPETLIATPSPVAEFAWHRMPGWGFPPIITDPDWYTASATLIGHAGFRFVAADGSVLGETTRVAGVARERAEFAFRSPGGEVFAEAAGFGGRVIAPRLSKGMPFTRTSGDPS